MTVSENSFHNPLLSRHLSLFAVMLSVLLSPIFTLNSAIAESSPEENPVGLILNEVPKLGLKRSTQIDKQHASELFSTAELRESVSSLVSDEGQQGSWMDLLAAIRPAKGVREAMQKVKTCLDFFRSPQAYPVMAGKSGEIWLGETLQACDLAKALTESSPLIVPSSPEKLPVVESLCDPKRQAGNLFSPPKEFRSAFLSAKTGSSRTGSLKDRFARGKRRYDILSCSDVAEFWEEKELNDPKQLEATLALYQRNVRSKLNLYQSNGTIIILRPSALLTLKGEKEPAVFVTANWSSSTGNFALCQHNILGISKKSGHLVALRPWSPVYRCG